MVERKNPLRRPRTNSITIAARGYLGRGFKPVPVKPRSKKPIADDWPNQAIGLDDVEEVFSNARLNIGLQLGAASGGLTDVDLDCPEANALADAFLPPTEAIFGHASKPRSHRLYVTDLRLKIDKAVQEFKDTDGAMLAELRIGGGDKGAQTVAPPSTHPNGEIVAWDANGDPAQVDGDELKKYVAAVAAGALLARHYPHEGARHEAALVLGGFLARCGFDSEEIEHFVEHVAAVAGDEEAEERARSAAGAVAHQEGGGNIAGMPRLIDVWGEAVAKSVAKWLGFREDQSLTQYERIAQQIADLAALPPLDYEQARADAARNLGIRVSKLDGFVDSERAKAAAKNEPPPPNLYELAMEADELIACSDILGRFGEDFGSIMVGEQKNAKLVFLIGVSRLFDKPMHAAIKGPSAGGKSELRSQVLRFFPPEDVISFTGLSEKALLYAPDDFSHKILSMGEALTGEQVKFQDYLLRELMSEGILRYMVPMKVDGVIKTITIERKGPVAFLVTTTRNKLNPENETRMVSIEIDDSAEQTERVMLRVARAEGFGGLGGQIDFALWHNYHRWLAAGERRVVVPFAMSLARSMARMMPAKNVRMRRDIGQICRAVKAHALVHRQHRKLNANHQIVATFDDYKAVRGLMADMLATAVEAKIRKAVAETVEALERVQHAGNPVTAREIAEVLHLDASTVWRRLQQAEAAGLVENMEDKPRHPGRYRLTDREPMQAEILPEADVVEAEFEDAKARARARRR